jgi:hypothetical protein
MKYCYIFLFLLAFGLNACKKDAPTTEFYYVQTYCADVWCQDIQCGSEDVVKQAVSTYLTNTLQVEFSNLHFTTASEPDLCNACSCKTGKWIRISANESYKTVLVNAGFKVD